MSTAPQPVEVTTPGDRDIVLVRSFAAPRELVWEALTTPELLGRWYGARGWHLVVCEVDLRVGGTYRFVSEDGAGQQLGQSGTFLEVVAPTRLVATEVFDAQSYPGESVVSRGLVDAGGRTTVTTTVRLPSPAARDRVLRYPMAEGFGQACERLDGLLAEIAPDPSGARRVTGTRPGGAR
ncbi:SRPBCC domain-containing protein [Nitriliruptor alkaliphilus]|uniref:SRPBCC domain-containing protein n=1 Tax=Nitriliruptor alkaliphilus TaxID=427918 RepID=UPI0009FA7DC3|nr:SRPBCC domain-containing protein [Nitriliruptor alkaliphilus]